MAGPMRPLLRQADEDIGPIGGDTPFELLDPCCQKEILNEKHHARVGRQLRGGDRSQVRLDERQRAIGSVINSSHHHHHHHDHNCSHNHEQHDYPLLAELRRQRLALQSEVETESMTTPNVSDNANAADDSDELDSDDEELLAGLDRSLGLSSEEKRLYEGARQEELQKENALKMGYGVHTEASVDHLLKIVTEHGEAVVCHVYEPELTLCAMIDLELETLAGDFLGTRFRRICASAATRRAIVSLCGDKGLNKAESSERSPAEKNIRVSAVEAALSSQRPLLVCCVAGTVTVVETQLQQFGADDTVFAADLRSYLERARVLFRTPGEGMTMLDMERMQSRVKALQESDSEEEEAGDWCDVVGCTKKFYHTHIGVAGGSSLVRAADEPGKDALG